MDKVQTEVTSLTGRLAEKIVNLPLIKSYTAEERESIEGRRLLDKLLKVKEKRAWIEQVNTGLKDFFMKIPNFVIIGTGAVMLLSGQITPTIFVGYYLYANKCCDYVGEHILLWIAAKTAQGATYRLSETMEEQEEKQEGSAEPLAGDIRFEHVTFAYGDKKVLDDVSFTAKAGTVTAFVGYSGCGKTTCLNLIERFYTPISGTISIGGRDIQSWGASAYRKNIFYLTQNAPAMNGSARDAITYGLPGDFTEAEMNIAVKNACADEVIKKIGGLDTQIGSFGGHLSGGQKQRLGLARAFLSKQKYMIPDEPTSALDVDAARRAQDALFHSCADRTILLPAHNVHTILNADKIVVFQDGKVLAEGSHENLMKRFSFYRDLLRTQGLEG